MTGYIMFLASKVPTVRYVATFLIASSTMVLGPMSNAQISANVVSDTARSSAIGFNVRLLPCHANYIFFCCPLIPFKTPEAYPMLTVSPNT